MFLAIIVNTASGTELSNKVYSITCQNIAVVSVTHL
jgi:hypothetical protein